MIRRVQTRGRACQELPRKIVQHGGPVVEPRRNHPQGASRRWPGAGPRPRWTRPRTRPAWHRLRRCCACSGSLDRQRERGVVSPGLARWRLAVAGSGGGRWANWAPDVALSATIRAQFRFWSRDVAREDILRDHLDPLDPLGAVRSGRRRINPPGLQAWPGDAAAVPPAGPVSGPRRVRPGPHRSTGAGGFDGAQPPGRCGVSTGSTTGFGPGQRQFPRCREARASGSGGGEGDFGGGVDGGDHG